MAGRGKPVFGRGRGRVSPTNPNPMNINLSKILEESKAKYMPEKPQHPHYDFDGVPMTIFSASDRRKCPLYRNWLLPEEVCLIDNIWQCWHKQPSDLAYLKQVISVLANYFKSCRKNYDYYVVYQGKLPGIYRYWKEVIKATKGTPNPLYKGYENLVDAHKDALEQLGPNYHISDSITPYSEVVKEDKSFDVMAENIKLRQQIDYLHSLMENQHQGPLSGFSGIADMDYYESFHELDEIPVMGTSSNPIFPENYLTLAELEKRQKGKAKAEPEADKIQKDDMSAKIQEAVRMQLSQCIPDIISGLTQQMSGTTAVSTISSTSVAHNVKTEDKADPPPQA